MKLFAYKLLYHSSSFHSFIVLFLHLSFWEIASFLFDMSRCSVLMWLNLDQIEL